MVNPWTFSISYWKHTHNNCFLYPIWGVRKVQMNIKPSLECTLHVFFINMSMQNDITSYAFTILSHFKYFIVTLANSMVHWTMFFQPYWFKQSLCGRQTSQMDHNNPALGWHFDHNLLRDFWNREPRLWVLSHFGCVWLFATLWILACQAPLSMGFPSKNTGGLPCPSPGDLPDPEIKPASFMSPALAGGFFTISTTWEAQVCCIQIPNSQKRWDNK